GPAGVFDKREPKPSMRDVKAGDLESPVRMMSLFLDAEQRGMVKRCEAEKLAFFAAAERAKRVATRNAAGCFAQIIRKRYFNFAAQDDEDLARLKLLALEEGRPNTFFPVP